MKLQVFAASRGRSYLYMWWTTEDEGEESGAGEERMPRGRRGGDNRWICVRRGSEHMGAVNMSTASRLGWADGRRRRERERESGGGEESDRREGTQWEKKREDVYLWEEGTSVHTRATASGRTRRLHVPLEDTDEGRITCTYIGRGRFLNVTDLRRREGWSAVHGNGHTRPEVVNYGMSKEVCRTDVSMTYERI